GAGAGAATGGRSGRGNAGSGAGSGPVVPATTPEERRTAADRKLDASLGDFDAQVRKEQARIAREREDRRTARNGGADGGGEGSGAGASDGREGRGARDRRGDGDMHSDADGREGSGQRRNGDLKSDQGGANGGGGSGGGAGKGPSNIPPGVGTGENDDLVAKQLREAAEKETDPELREKLWKEYQDYKNSVKR
ncbi:MAG: hypothetical protein JSS24_01060, partial [Proteobacteria bacterium]|nr:hypothetical protein [Pseudomonadota bacterium]